jgi:DNA-binding CsgD family transcriptional regulator/PAS domain-containing protein
MAPKARKPPDSVNAARDAGSNSADAIARLLDFPLAIAVIDLLSGRIVAANSAAGRLFEASAKELAGRPMIDFLDPDSLTNARRDLADLREGRFEGYQTRGTFVTFLGNSFAGDVWVRRLDGSVSPPEALVCVVSHEGDGDAEPYGVVITNRDSRSMMLVTDQDWRIEYASADADSVLGVAPSGIIDTPLLGMMHPGDAPDFLFAVSRAIMSHRAVICRVRLRMMGQPWRDVVCIVHLLSEDSPPRLGIMAISAKEDGRSDAGPNADLEEALTRIALELRAVGVIPTLPEVLDQTDARVIAGLSSRQWEILARLTRGESASKIAAAMFLSQSTVRNHLSQLYRKFNVHSQLELVSLFRSKGPWEDPDPAQG